VISALAAKGKIARSALDACAGGQIEQTGSQKSCSSPRPKIVLRTGNHT
jgi:hypothetical protein